MPILSKCRNFVTNSWNCTKFEAPARITLLPVSYLSMTVTVFFLIWEKVDVSTETVGVAILMANRK